MTEIADDSAPPDDCFACPPDCKQCSRDEGTCACCEHDHPYDRARLN